MDKIAIVVPTYNNLKTINEVVNSILNLNLFTIVVDDGSNYEVDKILNKNKNLKIIKHKENLGKGRAILTGAKEAKKLGYNYFITIDSDGQHLVSDIKKFIDSFEDKNEIVIGVRNFNSTTIPNSSIFGRKFSNFWVFIETWKKLKDTQSGFRLYPITILNLNLNAQKYDFEIEVLVKHLWSKSLVKEVDIEVIYPKDRVSHFDKLKDNIRLSLLHSKLFFLRYFLFKGFF